MTKIREEDTIAAISTPTGPGGIGIIRMSGSKSLSILRQIFRPSDPSCPLSSRRLYHGFISSPEAGRELDEALCVYMKAPGTYTREDIVEIQCHAGHAVLGQILALCTSMGARLAEPGEFTRRAFLNGRIDLAQAEAVMDLTCAEASGLSNIGIGAVRGELSSRIETIREGLVSCLAALEVAIDYPEEDEEILGQARLNSILEEEVLKPLKALTEAFDRTKVHRFGASTVLAGRPNAGKSSLLNALSCEDKAIVTEIPGTTRDVVEARIEIGGACVTLLDTAGVRNQPDPIETMGIQKIREIAPSSHLFLWLLDITENFDDSDRAVLEMLEQFGTIPVIIVFNKIDKIMQEPATLSQKLLKKIDALSPKLAESPCCFVSAKKQTGIETLRDLIRQILLGQESRLPAIAPNLRQKEILEKTLNLTKQGLKALDQGLSPEIPALDIRQALNYLGEITGETATEVILEQIFSKFCLGK